MVDEFEIDWRLLQGFQYKLMNNKNNKWTQHNAAKLYKLLEIQLYWVLEEDRKFKYVGYFGNHLILSCYLFVEYISIPQRCKKYLFAKR